MAVKGSGALSILNDIVAEFGGDAPHSLSEYYGGGDYVPAGANPGIATSGQINMGSHYSAVAATVLNITSNVNNYDIGAEAIAAGGDKSTPVILTINAGVTVGSTSTSTAAMFTGTGWSSGTTINITNNGSIVGPAGAASDGTIGSNGAGGAGGVSASGDPYGANGSPGSAGGSGSASGGSTGGNAFEHSQTADTNLSVIFDIAGTRTAGAGGTVSGWGGGGGGGGGAGMSYFGTPVPGGAGGRGRGISGAASAGTAGTVYGPDYYGYYHNGGAGGTGGDYATYGLAGERDSAPQKYGGAGGAGGTTVTSTGSAGSVLAGNTGQIS